jgi:hypothetical protein
MANPKRDRPARLVLEFSGEHVQEHAIDAVAQLARLSSMALLGLFIEDAGLMAAASLPFVRQFDASRRAWTRLSQERLQEELAALAATLRRNLERSAARSGVPAEFSVMRGDPGAALVSHTGPGDWIAVFDSIASWPRRRLGAAAGTVFVPRGAAPRHGPIVAVAGSADDLAIAFAKLLAEAAERDLVVVDLPQEHSKGYWLARRGGTTASTAAPEAPPRQPQVSLPHASLVVLSAATLERFGDQVLALAAGRGEPWLVLAQS